MFKKWIDEITKSDTSESVAAADMRQVSVQLMLEVARCDASIDDIERDAIVKSLLDKSRFAQTQVDALMAESERAVESSISFYEHIRLVNDQFDQLNKVNLIEQMWEVAYADGHLDALEEAFIRQVADLIYVKHRDFLQAKHRVMPAGS